MSGDLGSGKSSVAALLAEELGWELVSTGSIQRDIARELELSTLATNVLSERDPTIDDRVDGVTRRLGQEAVEPLVFDSRLAWHFLESALRVRLLVDPEVAVKRIMARGATDVEEYEHEAMARREVHERFESEVRRFRSRYDVDVTDLSHFDLVVDTSDITPADVVARVRAALDNPGEPTVVYSPLRTVPEIASEARQSTLRYCRPFFYSTSSSDTTDPQSVPLSAVTLSCEHIVVDERRMLDLEESRRADFRSYRVWNAVSGL